MADLFLVEFKGSRKEYFFNTYYHTLRVSDYVITEADRGEDIGVLTKRIGKELEFSSDNRPRSILRRASQEDIERLMESRQKENEYKPEVIEMIGRHNLEMKVVDIECQYDGNKMTIFFTADHRVDFRELVKDLAARFRTRIELRQIGVRDEAKRLGGIGVCGKPQCCNAYLTEFIPISTQHAREQNLPLNPSKISGNCGRLLCCLRYELDHYNQIKRKFPPLGSLVNTSQGEGTLVRIDVFKEEAVIRIEDSMTRARAEEITVLDISKHEMPARTRSIIEEYEEGALDQNGKDQETALRDLEDKDETN